MIPGSVASRRVASSGVEPGARVPLFTAIQAVAAGQLSRVRVARVPLLLVATVQSVGVVVLLRGVLRHTSVSTASAVVAGSSVLVVAFVALNLLAQRFGALRAEGALDYYSALPISPSAVVLGTAASYAAFTVPGAVVTAAVGVGVYDLPASRLWVVVPTVIVAALALAGVGSLLGLALPRPELATVAGQLGMTVVLFLGVIPSGHLPDVLRAVRVAVPGMLAVDGFADALHPDVPWGHVVAWFAITVGYGAAALWLAGRCFRRAVDR